MATPADEAQREDRQKIIAVMAEKAGVTAERMIEAVRRRVAKEATTPDLLLFLHTANTYGLDPLATPSQIALFVPKNKDGGVPKPYVTFDGWLRILMSHPRYYNHGWKDDVWSGGQRGKGTMDSITFWIDRFEPKHAKHAAGPCDCVRDVFDHTELLSECREKGDFTPWNKWPVRMLKEKAAMQGTRFCFGMYVPDFDDLQQADAFERGRAEERATAQAETGPAQGPIAPAAAIPGAKRATRKKAAETVPVTSEGDPVAKALPAPDVAGQTTIEDFLRGTAEKVPEAVAAAVLGPSPLKFPEMAGPSAEAKLPEFDPAESLALDAELAKAGRDDDFTDILG